MNTLFQIILLFISKLKLSNEKNCYCILFFIPLFFTKEKVFSLEISGSKSRVFFHSEFLGRDISYPNKKKEKKDTRSRGEVNIPWRWKILSPNLFVYIECVVSIPRMIRTRIFVSDLGRRYSGVPARACSLYQEIYIYIYQSQKYHVLVPRDGERDRGKWEGRSGF